MKTFLVAAVLVSALVLAGDVAHAQRNTTGATSGSCTSTLQCSPGYYCIQGFCSNAPAAQVTPGTYLTACSPTQPCNAGLICVDTVCTYSGATDPAFTTTNNPTSAAGTSNVKGIAGLAEWIITFINGYLVPVLFALGFIYFLFGVFRYFILGGADEEKRQKGQQFVMWSIIGFVLMLSVWGIINIFVATFQLDNTSHPNFPQFTV